MAGITSKEDTSLRFSRRDEGNMQKILRDLRALQQQVDAIQALANSNEGRLTTAGH